MVSKDVNQNGQQQKSERELDRQQRLDAALRENLRKRKQQARARKAPSPENSAKENSE